MANHKILLWSLFLMFFVSAVFANVPATPPFAPEEGIYLTKNEFDAFLQRYHSEHSTQSGSGKSLAWKKGRFTITPYGYINLSASYETKRTTTGDYAVFANSPDLDNDSGFNVDPKSTRMGLKIESSGVPGWHGSKSEGVIEFDFQGAFQSRNRGNLLLRKAYVAVSDGQTKFLAGQDWEIISPLYPKTLNYTAGACVGNVGYRRAMLRLDHQFHFCHSNHFVAQFGITDHVFRDNTYVVPASTSWPVVQGRIAYVFGKSQFQHGKPMTLGVSAHIGEQQFTFAGNDRKNLKTWSFNIDFDLPITKKLGIQMEYFLGENLATIEGGILQGVDTQRRNTIRSQGGWAASTYQATEKLQTNLGYMIDDPFNNDVVSGNSNSNLARNYSHCLFVNALYNWSDALMTGFEVDFWRTHWQRYNPDSQTITPLTPGTPIRYEFTVRYTF
ncbi:MAG: hypothetical protein LBI18_07805 [Planctomycetaceae bacterium]|jgi:hypothetical protein|nr:hypothetical protein [Planctomycetaceae bacterium]